MVRTTQAGLPLRGHERAAGGSAFCHHSSLELPGRVALGLPFLEKDLKSHEQLEIKPSKVMTPGAEEAATAARPGPATLAETWPREGRGAALRRPRPPGNSPRALPPFRGENVLFSPAAALGPELLRPQGWARARSQAAGGGLQEETLQLFPAYKRSFLTCRTHSDRRLDN